MKFEVKGNSVLLTPEECIDERMLDTLRVYRKGYLNVVTQDLFPSMPTLMVEMYFSSPRVDETFINGVLCEIS